MLFRNVLLGLAAILMPSLVLAQALPPEVDALLARARIPRDAVAMLVVDATGKATPRLSHRADVAVNPASVMKLVTTYAALDLLGPAYTWRTPIWVDGAVRDGTLFGNLYIRGQGDPKLVVERLWLLMRQVRGLGIDTIAGDIVLDHSAFESIETDPGSFDGEPLRPYNASPDALLLNFKSVVMTFAPERSTNMAQVYFQPPLAGVQMQTRVPLGQGECGDYRAALKADFSDPTRIGFTGVFPALCGEKTWPVAYADPKTYAVRAIEGMWREMGGKLNGRVRDGLIPEQQNGGPPLQLLFELGSPTLSEVIRDVNKYSNNVMAQQVFLSLSLPAREPNGVQSNAVASHDASREVVMRWWKDRIDTGNAPLLDNGSGLSRQSRISAQALARLLQVAYQSPQMPELMSSLPITGVDGTLRRSRAKAQGSAHLKTGSLRDVVAVAGYVHAASGKRYALVAVVNYPNANAARPAIDALMDWAVNDN